MSSVAQPVRLRLRPIALPVEHGGWGFVLEPLVLALIVAASWRGAALAVAVLASFLVRQPLKIAAGDLLKKKRYPRTTAAIRFVLLYGAIAAIAFALSLIGSFRHVVPLLFAAPFIGLQLFYDVSNRSRSVVAELAGAAAMGATAAAIGIAGGLTTVQAYALWLLLVCRTVPSVIYVRERLRLERAGAAAALLSFAAHVAAVAIAWIVYLRAGVSILVVVPLLVLLVRSVVGLSPVRRRVAAKTVGFTEIGYGAMLVALVAISFLIR